MKWKVKIYSCLLLRSHKAEWLKFLTFFLRVIWVRIPAGTEIFWCSQIAKDVRSMAWNNAISVPRYLNFWIKVVIRYVRKRISRANNFSAFWKVISAPLPYMTIASSEFQHYQCIPIDLLYDIITSDVNIAILGSYFRHGNYGPKIDRRTLWNSLILNIYVRMYPVYLLALEFLIGLITLIS